MRLRLSRPLPRRPRRPLPPHLRMVPGLRVGRKVAWDLAVDFQEDRVEVVSADAAVAVVKVGPVSAGR